MIRRRFHALMKLGQTYYTFSGSLCIYIYRYLWDMSILHVYIHIFICIDYLYLFFFVHTTGQRTYSERSLMSWHWKKNWALFQQILSHLQSEVSNNRWSHQNACGTCRKLTYTFYMLRIYIYTLWFTHEQWWFSIFFFVNVYQRGYR
jgi:hypothetical protein